MAPHPTSTTCEGDTLPARTLRALQRDAFDYFIQHGDRETGLVRDKSAPDWPASIAAMGMALTAYLVGAERQFISRAEASVRTLATLRFLARSEQSTAPTATGYKGFYYHFLDMQTGQRTWRCELSSIDTALLIAGALAAAEYFERNTADEAEIRSLAQQLYARVDWQWMLNGGQTVRHGWRPKRGFLPFSWQGYDESLILYVLALGSPTHPIHPDSYAAWCSTHAWTVAEGMAYLHAGPLFIHQMSHIWCDLRGIRDAFMRAHDSDYFENSRRATLIQQRYAMHNPLGFAHYGQWCWGLSASDGPGARRGKTKTVRGVKRQFFDYLARGVPFGPDDGTLAPWAVAASLPFAPETVAPTIAHLATLPFSAGRGHSPASSSASPTAFNAEFGPVREGDMAWVSPYHFGIDEGPTVLMIENHRSGLIWQLMRGCKPICDGLRAAGFTGGWLAS